MTPHRGQDTTEDVRDEARHCRCSQHQQVPCACHWEGRIVWVNDIGATLWSPYPLVNRNFPWKTVPQGGHTSTPDGLAVRPGGSHSTAFAKPAGVHARK